MVKALPEFNSLFRRNSTVNSSLDHFDRCFAPAVHKRCYVKQFPGMGKHKFRNGVCRFSEHVTEDVVEFEIGYSKTILCTVLFTNYHAGEFVTVSYQVPQMADVSGWNKGRSDHVTHVKVTDPFCILAVSFVSLSWFRILGMGKGNKKIVLLQDVKDRDPILAGRFHTNVRTVVFSKPVRQLL